MTSEQSVNDFLESLASKEPIPGGGGAAALAGALGAALGSMVSNLTLGKKKYADVQEQVASLLEKTNVLRAEFWTLVDEDAKVFYQLAQAYSLPKETDEQKKHREAVMERLLLDASLVPLKIMEKASGCLDILEQLAAMGSKLVISDVGVGTQLCRASLLGASMNIFINTKLMQNRHIADSLNEKASALIESGVKKADAVYNNVLQQIT